MPAIIRIKRSGDLLAPANLKVGELAYSYASLSKTLYIGIGPAINSDGDAAQVVAIGGEKFTALMSVTPGISSPQQFLLLGDSRNTDYLKLQELVADSATIGNLNVVTGYSQYFNADSAYVSQIIIDSGYSKYLKVDSAYVSQLVSDSAQITYANIETSYQPLITGPSEIVIDPAGIGDNTGKVHIKGDLQVDGIQTIINSTEVSTNDKNITLADSAVDSSAASGAGITIYGPDQDPVYGRASFYWDATENEWVATKGINSPYIDADSGRIGSISGSFTNYDSGYISQFTSDSANIHTITGSQAEYTFGIFNTVSSTNYYKTDAIENALIKTQTDTEFVQDANLVFGNYVSAFSPATSGLHIGFEDTMDSGYYNFIATNEGYVQAQSLKIGDHKNPKTPTANPMAFSFSGNENRAGDFYGIEVNDSQFISTALQNVFRSDYTKLHAQTLSPTEDSSRGINIIRIASIEDSDLVEFRKDGSINFEGDLFQRGLPFVGGGVFRRVNNANDVDVNDIAYTPEKYSVAIDPYSVGAKVGINTDKPHFDFDFRGSQFSISGQITSQALAETSTPLDFHLQPLSVVSGLTSFGISADDSDKSRLLFDTKSARFRAGYFSYDKIVDGNMGTFSTAFGRDTVAKGRYSFASGDSSEAYGHYSIAMGKQSLVDGEANSLLSEHSIAIGKEQKVKSSQEAVALGSENQISNSNSAIAIGKNNVIGTYSPVEDGSKSISIGTDNIVNDNLSAAFGTNNTVEGNQSFAIGFGHTIPKPTSGNANNFAFGANALFTTETSFSTAIGNRAKFGNADGSVAISLGLGSTNPTDANYFRPIQDNSLLSIQNGNVSIGTDSDQVSAGLSTGQGNLLVVGDIIYEGELFKRTQNGLATPSPWVDNGFDITYNNTNDINEPKPIGINISNPNHLFELDGDFLTRGTYKTTWKTDTNWFDSAAGTSDFGTALLASTTSPSIFGYHTDAAIFRVGKLKIAEQSNDSMGDHSIGMGYYSKVNGKYAIVAGGHTNHALGDYSGVFTGKSNIATGSYSTIIGAVSGEVEGSKSLIIGGNASKVLGNNSISIATGSGANHIRGNRSVFIGEGNVDSSRTTGAGTTGTQDRNFFIGRTNVVDSDGQDVKDNYIIGKDNTIATTNGKSVFLIGKNTKISSTDQGAGNQIILSAPISSTDLGQNDNTKVAIGKTKSRGSLDVAGGNVYFGHKSGTMVADVNALGQPIMRAGDSFDVQIFINDQDLRDYAAGVDPTGSTVIIVPDDVPMPSTTVTSIKQSNPAIAIIKNTGGVLTTGTTVSFSIPGIGEIQSFLNDSTFALRPVTGGLGDSFKIYNSTNTASVNTNKGTTRNGITLTTYDSSTWGDPSGIPVGTYVSLKSAPVAVTAPTHFKNSVIIDSDLIVKGTVSLQDSMRVSKDVIIDGNLDITTGYIKGGNYLDITRYGKFGDSLNVGGNITGGGTLTITDSATVTGNITTNRDLAVTGKVHVGDSVTIVGDLTIGGSVRWLDDTYDDSFYIGNMSFDSYVLRPGSKIFDALWTSFDTDYVQQRTDSENNWQVYPDALVYNPNDGFKAVTINQGNDDAWTGWNPTLNGGGDNAYSHPLSKTGVTPDYPSDDSALTLASWNNRGQFSGDGDSVALDVRGRVNIRQNPGLDDFVSKPPLLVNGAGWPNASWIRKPGHIDNEYIRAQMDADFIRSFIDSAFVISIWDSDYYWKHDSFNAVYIGVPDQLYGSDADTVNPLYYNGNLKVAINRTGRSAKYNLDVVGNARFTDSMQFDGIVVSEKNINAKKQVKIGSYIGFDNVGYIDESKLTTDKGLYVGDSTHLRLGLTVLGHDNILDSVKTFTFDDAYLQIKESNNYNTATISNKLGSDVPTNDSHAEFVFSNDIDYELLKVLRTDQAGVTTQLVRGTHYDSLGNTALFDSDLYSVGGAFNALKATQSNKVYIHETALASTDLNLGISNRYIAQDSNGIANIIIGEVKTVNAGGNIVYDSFNILDDGGDSLSIKYHLAVLNVIDPVVILQDSLGVFKGQLVKDADFTLVDSHQIRIKKDLEILPGLVHSNEDNSVTDSAHIEFGDKFVISDFSPHIVSKSNIVGVTNLYGHVNLGTQAMANAAYPGYNHTGSRLTTHDSFVVKGGMLFESDGAGGEGRVQYNTNFHVDSEKTVFFGPQISTSTTTITTPAYSASGIPDATGHYTDIVPAVTNTVIEKAQLGMDSHVVNVLSLMDSVSIKQLWMAPQGNIFFGPYRSRAVLKQDSDGLGTLLGKIESDGSYIGTVTGIEHTYDSSFRITLDSHIVEIIENPPVPSLTYEKPVTFTKTSNYGDDVFVDSEAGFHISTPIYYYKYESDGTGAGILNTWGPSTLGSNVYPAGQKYLKFQKLQLENFQTYISSNSDVQNVVYKIESDGSPVFGGSPISATPNGILHHVLNTDGSRKIKQLALDSHIVRIVDSDYIGERLNSPWNYQTTTDGVSPRIYHDEGAAIIVGDRTLLAPDDYKTKFIIDSGNAVFMSNQVLDDSVNALSVGTVPSLGDKTRMMWVPTRGAFRAGALTGTAPNGVSIAQADLWNDSHIGYLSVGIGTNTNASHYSTALGYGAIAGLTKDSSSSNARTHTGFHNTYNAVSIGHTVRSLSNNSIAIGKAIDNQMVIANSPGSTGNAWTDSNMISIGYNIANTRSRSTLLGADLVAKAEDTVLIGRDIILNNNGHTRARNVTAIGKSISTPSGAGRSKNTLYVGHEISNGATSNTGNNTFIGKDLTISGNTHSSFAIGRNITLAGTTSAGMIGSDISKSGSGTGTLIGFNGAVSKSGLAIGRSVSSDAGVAIGKNVASTHSSGSSGVAIGFNVKAGQNAIGIGFSLLSVDKNSTNVGRANITARDAVSLGRDNNSGSRYDVTIGKGNVTSGSNSPSIAMGINSVATGQTSVAIGHTTKSRGKNSLTIGKSNDTTSQESILIGVSNTQSPRTVVVGYSNTGGGSHSGSNKNDYEIVVGSYNTGNSRANIFGTYNTNNTRVSIYGSENNNVATGSGNNAKNALIYGRDNTITENNGIVYGAGNEVSNNAIGFGRNEEVTAQGLSFGTGNAVNYNTVKTPNRTISSKSIAFGRDNDVDREGIAFGRNNTADNNGIVFGRSSIADSSGIALGTGVTGSGIGALALGSVITVGGPNTSSALNSVGIGLGTASKSVTHDNILSIQGGQTIISISPYDSVHSIPATKTLNSSNQVVTAPNVTGRVSVPYALEVNGDINVTEDYYMQGMRMYNYIRQVAADSDWILDAADSDYVKTVVTQEYLRATQTADEFFHNHTEGPGGNLYYNGTGIVGIGLQHTLTSNTPGYNRYNAAAGGIPDTPVVDYKLDVAGNVNLEGLTYHGDVILPLVQEDAVYLNHYQNFYTINIDEESASLWFDSFYVNERAKFGIGNNNYDSFAVMDLIDTFYIDNNITKVWPDSAYVFTSVDSLATDEYIAFRPRIPIPQYGDFPNIPIGSRLGQAQYTNPVSAFEPLFGTRVGIGTVKYNGTSYGTEASQALQNTEAVQAFGSTPGYDNSGLAVAGKVVIHGPNDPSLTGIPSQPALQIFNGHISIDGVPLDLSKTFANDGTYTTYQFTDFIGVGKTTPTHHIDVNGRINADSGLYIAGQNIFQLLDSDFVQSAVTFSYLKDFAGVDSSYIQSAIDSAYMTFVINEPYIKEIVDSAYIQGIADSAYIFSVADSGYIQSVVDSAYILSAADSDYVLSVADSSYILSAANSDYILGIADSGHILSAADSNYIISALQATNSIIPATTEVYDIGSLTHRFKDLFLSGTTINLGGTLIKSTASGISVTDSNGIASRVIGVDSNAVLQFVDSSYVRARADSGYIQSITDSAYIFSVADSGYISGIIDSSYVSSRVTISDDRITSVITDSYIATSTGIGLTAVDFGQNNILYNNTFTTATLPNAITYKGMVVFDATANLPKIAVGGSWDELARATDIRSIADSAAAAVVASAPAVLDTLNELAQALGNDADFSTTITTSIAEKLPLAGGTLTGDLDLGSNKILYSNVYATEGDLPSASTYHGMFAHVHGTGKGYFAHAGNWVQLVSANDIDSAYINARVVIPPAFDSADVVGIVDSAYIASRVEAGTDSAAILGMIDSAYIASRVEAGTDSAAILGMIDSAYISARVSGGGGIGEGDSAFISSVAASTLSTGFAVYKYSATAGQTVFSGNDLYSNTLSFITVDNSPIVYLNGALLRYGDDYTTGGTTTTVTLTSAASLGDEITIMAFNNVSGSVVYNTTTINSYTKPHFTNYKFEADSGSTTFSGNDVNGISLAFDSDRIQVFNNGIRLVNNADYTADPVTNVITTTYGLDSGDELIINALTYSDVLFDAGLLDSADIRSIAASGVDISDLPPTSPSPGQMWFDPEFLETYVYYTDDDTAQWVKANPSGFGANFDSNVFNLIDSAYISARVSASSGADSAAIIGLVDSAYVAARVSAGTDSAAIIGLVDSAYVAARTTAPNSWSEVTSTITATAGQRLILDTSTSIVVNLPASPTLGDEIRIIDGTGTAATNNITINRNGNKIEANDSDLTIDVNRAAFGLVYYNAANGWLFTEK